MIILTLLPLIPLIYPHVLFLKIEYITSFHLSTSNPSHMHPLMFPLEIMASFLFSKVVIFTHTHSTYCYLFSVIFMYLNFGLTTWYWLTNQEAHPWRELFLYLSVFLSLSLSFFV